MSQPAPVERRRFRRIEMERAATISVDGQIIDCELVDISLKGALISFDTDWQPEIGKRVDLLVLLSPNASSCIRVTAEIAHLGDRCIGTHIYSMDIESGENLRRLIEINLGDAEMLGRELSAMISDI